MRLILINKYLMLPRHEQFARTLAVTGDATAAAAQVGYKPGNGLKVTAHRLAQRADVQIIVAEERERLARGHQVGNDEIVSGLLQEARGEGMNTTAASRVAAWRTLADIRGLLGGTQTELPQGLAIFLEAIAAGAASGQREQECSADVEGEFRDVQGPYHA